MKNHLPNHRDNQQQRNKHHMEHSLCDGQPREQRRLRRVEQVAAGVVVSVFVYLAGSCFFEQQLHHPKIDRNDKMSRGEKL